MSHAAVAFSGGCDSAALLGMAREIFAKGVTAVTVDHRWAGMLRSCCGTNLATAPPPPSPPRLRPESSQEAGEAAQLAQQLGEVDPQ